ncbi:GntR family transcriptional regulator [Kytococcus sp. Marseille-QA3725]
MESFDDRTPIYLQIAERIRRDVAAGELGEGDQVMSTTQYATTHRINPATAGKALSLLVDEGVLEKRRGVGMFVTAGARDRVLATRREAFWGEVFDPALAEARTLGIDAEALVARIADRLGDKP